MAKNYVALSIAGQMNKFKTEVAAELGLQNYDELDKGDLTSRQNGYVGGNMTRKMVAYAESAIAQQGSAIVSGTISSSVVPERIRAMNEAASAQGAQGYLNSSGNGNTYVAAAGAQLQ